MKLFTEKTMESLQQCQFEQVKENELLALEGGLGCVVYESNTQSNSSSSTGPFGTNSAAYIWNAAMTIIWGSVGLSSTW